MRHFLFTRSYINANVMGIPRTHDWNPGCMCVCGGGGVNIALFHFQLIL